MKKLYTLIALVSIGVLLLVGNSYSQIAHSLSTTIYQRGDNTSFGGTSVGFFVKVTDLPGSGNRIYLESITITSLNTTANTVSIYVNATTYAQATVAAQDQLIGSVAYALGTTNIIGNHVRGQPAVLASTLPGISYLGDGGATFNFVSADGRPTRVTGFGFKPDNVAAGVAAHFTAVINYIKEGS